MKDKICLHWCMSILEIMSSTTKNKVNIGVRCDIIIQVNINAVNELMPKYLLSILTILFHN